jgi:hypothetical protein
MNIKNKVKLSLLFAIALSATPLLAGFMLMAQRSIAADPIPANQAQAVSPFNGMTIRSLPSFSKAINVQLPAEAQNLLKVSEIAANKGDTPDQKMPFSVWQTSFGAGDLSPNQAANLSGTPATIAPAMALSNFEFLKTTSVGEFVAANPQLANLPVDALPGLFPQIVPDMESYNPNTLGQLATDIRYKDSLLANLDTFKARDVPGFRDTPLNNYPAVAALPAEKIPFISTIPILKFPAISAKIQAGIPLGTIDTVNKAERSTRKTVSGSNKQPNAACQSAESRCDYVEILGFPRNPQMDGATIVSADSQSLNGGVNWPGEMVNGGKEPPGILPFGDSFKLSFNRVNPVDDTVQVNLNLRVCWGMLFYTTCTPYFIGQIPLFPIKAGSQFPLLLGNVQVPVSIEPPVADIPKNPLSKPIALGASESAPVPNTSPIAPALNYGSNIAQSFLKNTDAQDPGTVHNLGCEDGGRCVAAVGTTQIRSDTPLFRQYMNVMPAGKDILAQMDAGKPVNPVELASAFPPDEQRAIFNRILDRNTSLSEATVALSNILSPGVSWNQKIPAPISPINTLNIPKIYADALTQT